MGTALRFLSQVQKKHGVCFLISDFIVEDYRQAAQIAASKFDLIGIQVTDPAELDFPQVGLVHLKDPETGVTCWIDSEDPDTVAQLHQFTHKQRHGTKSTLQKMGASYIDLKMGQPFTHALSHFFKERQKRR